MPQREYNLIPPPTLQVTDPPPTPAAPNFSQVMEAAFGLENDVAAAMDLASRPVWKTNRKYDVVGKLKSSEWWGTDYQDNFLEAESDEEFNYIAGQIMGENRRRDTLLRAGWGGTAAAVAAGVLSPTMFIPLTAGGRGLTAVARGFGLGLAAGVAQEAPLQAAQATRTYGESMVGIGSAGLIGGVFGGAVAFMTRAERAAIEADMADMPNLSAIHKPVSGGAEATASQDPGKLAKGAGTMLRVTDSNPITASPVTQTLQSNSVTARIGMSRLSDAGLTLDNNALGIPTAKDGTVENNITPWWGRFTDTLDDNRNAYAEYVFNGAPPSIAPTMRASLQARLSQGAKLSRAEFNQAVFRAAFTGDTAVNAFVEKAAKAFRQKIFDYTWEQMKVVKGYDELVTESADLSYVPWVPDHQKIENDPVGFMKFLADKYNVKMQENFTAAWEKYALKQARDEEFLADSALTKEEIKELREQLGEQLAGVEKRREAEQFTALQDTIDALRAAARPLKSDIVADDAMRKQMLADARDMEQAAGPRFAETKLERREIKRRLSSLNKAVASLEEKRANKLAKIERAEELSEAGLMRIARKGQRILNEMENWTDEKLDAELSKLKNDFERVAGIYDRGEERIAKLAEGDEVLEPRFTTAGFQPERAEGVAPGTRVFVVHGGSDFDKVDFEKLGSGEPGGIRPLGKGLYTFVVDPANPEEALRAIDAAKHYSTKYGKGKKKLHVFSVPLTANTSFNGPKVGDFTNARTPAEQAYIDALDEADKIPRGPERLAAFARADELKKAADADPTQWQMRGERLPGNLTELSVLDKDILARVGKFDLEESDADILRKITEGPEPIADENMLRQDALQEARADRMTEVAERIADAEDLGRDAMRSLIGDMLDETIKRVNKINSKRAVRVNKLEAAVAELQPVVIAKQLDARRAGMTTRQIEFADKWRELGADDLPAPKGDILSGQADFSDVAMEAAARTLDKFRGTMLRLPVVDMLADKRSSMLPRLLSFIPTSEMAPWLEQDIEKIARHYVRTMSSDIEIAKKFDGEVNAESYFSEMSRTEKERLKAVAASDMKPEAKAKETARIQAELTQDLRNMEVTIKRLRHMHGLPQNPDGWGYRFAQMAADLNVLRFMGGVAISSVPDIGQPVMKYGLLRTFRDGYGPFVMRLKERKMLMREAHLAGVAIEAVTSLRASAVMDAFDDVGRGTKFERGLKYASGKQGVAAAFSFWTDGMKAITFATANAKIFDSIADVMAGSASKKTIQYLASLGFTEARMQDIWNEVLKNGGGGKVNGVWLPNTELWKNGEAVQAYRQAVAREANRTIITPGVERPEWMTGTTMGRLVGQFKSFGMSSTYKTMAAGLQQRDAAVVQGVMSSLALGALSYYLWGVAGGGERYKRMMESGLDQWADEAIARSGLGGMFTYGQEILNRVPLTAPYTSFSGQGTTRRGGDDIVDQVGGPTWDLIQRSLQVITGIDDPTQATVHAARLLTPYQNVSVISRLFDGIEQLVNQTFDVPERRQ